MKLRRILNNRLFQLILLIFAGFFAFCSAFAYYNQTDSTEKQVNLAGFEDVKGETTKESESNSKPEAKPGTTKTTPPTANNPAQNAQTSPVPSAPTIQGYYPNYIAVINGFLKADSCFLDALKYMQAADFTSMDVTVTKCQSIIWPLKSKIDLGYNKDAASPDVFTLRSYLLSAYSQYDFLFGRFWSIEVSYNNGAEDLIASSLTSMKSDWTKAQGYVDAAKNEWATISH